MGAKIQFLNCIVDQSVLAIGATDLFRLAYFVQLSGGQVIRLRDSKAIGIVAPVHASTREPGGSFINT